MYHTITCKNCGDEELEFEIKVGNYPEWYIEKIICVECGYTYAQEEIDELYNDRNLDEKISEYVSDYEVDEGD